MRKLLAIVLASSTFGGAVGALATAATQSQASPAAIAAAVQRVQDQAADRSLGTIASRIGSASTTLSNIFVQDRTTASDVAPTGPLASQLYSIEAQLYGLCVQTGSNPTICQLPPAPELRHRR